MKKKLITFLFLTFAIISLAGCNFSSIINDFFSFAGLSFDGGNPGDSNYQYSDISTPPAGELVARKASYNMSDMVSNSVYPLSYTPSVGRTKLLIIPIWFSNSSAYIKVANKENVREDIQKAYFGTNEETGWYSVKTFYEEESHGALTLSGTVSEWRNVSDNFDKYAVDKDTSKTKAIVEDSVTWYFRSHSDERRSDYDLDGDGYLDGVILIYAAPDHTALGIEEYDNLWAYCFWIQDYSAQDTRNPGTNAFFWASYDFMYGREKVSERTGYSYSTFGNNYISGDTSHAEVDTHTYIHEMGHMFGLEDYYDYSEHKYSPAGSFSMQDHNIGSHDPYSSFVLGWGKAYVPTSSTTIDLKPFTSSGEMILLTPQWNSGNSPFDEYLLLEYYTADGVNALDTSYQYMKQYSKVYPLGSKVPGVRLWHVDSRLLYTRTGEFTASQNETNPKTSKGRVALMMSNTYRDGSAYADQYITPLGASYADYNLLQLIRNNKSATYKPTDDFDKDALFVTNDTFKMSDYSRQFVNGGKLNNNKYLGFSFTVNACNSTYASIEIIKE